MNLQEKSEQRVIQKKELGSLSETELGLMEVLKGSPHLLFPLVCAVRISELVNSDAQSPYQLQHSKIVT